MRTKEEVLEWIKSAIEHKRQCKQDVENEFAARGEKVNVVFL